MARKRVLFVFPTSWDRRQLRNAEADWSARHEVVFAEPDDDACPADLDVARWLDEIERDHKGRVDGVLSSSDYPGATLAAAAAERLGLPGPRPVDVLRCSHKWYSRLAQREAAPEAVPEFALVDATRPRDLPAELRFPCFVKPVKGAFSVHARRVDSAEELSRFLATAPVQEFVSEYLALFDDLLERFTDFEVDGSHFLAEGLIRGAQATVEGYATESEVVVLGVVDSVMHPGTNSFLRFDLPSRLPAEVVERMAEVARATIRGLGLAQGQFNIEMAWDAEANLVRIIEVNPRLCGQFGDLYRKVIGQSSYEAALDLACGDVPRPPPGSGHFQAAASFPLRVFEPVVVERAPSVEDVRIAESMQPAALVWVECRTGDRLGDFDRGEDGASARYGIVNVGGEDADECAHRCDAMCHALDFRFRRTAEPVRETP